MNKKLQLTIPRWQGGDNPNYQLGATILSNILPLEENEKKIQVEVEKPSQKLEIIKGVKGYDELLKQSNEIEKILNQENPDKLIIVGGDCSVSQVPFSYLKEKYGDKLGLLWLDAHPDVATLKDSSHLHEMVLGNLLGQNKESELTKVKNTFKSEEVLMVGLKEDDLREIDALCTALNLKIVSTEQVHNNIDLISNWIQKHEFEYIAIHFDLDVLHPNDFRSIYPAEPYTQVEDFPAAVGNMTLQNVANVLEEVEKYSTIVGLTIAEHLPWDMINLRNVLRKSNLFK